MLGGEGSVWQRRARGREAEGQRGGEAASQQNGQPHIHLWWIKIRETFCEPVSPGQTVQPRALHLEKESLITSGCKPGGGWGGGRNCQFLTHPGNHNRDSSQRGASHIREVGEVTGNRVRARQAPRSQTAVALSPL